MTLELSVASTFERVLFYEYERGWSVGRNLTEPVQDCLEPSDSCFRVTSRAGTIVAFNEGWTSPRRST